MALLYLFSMRFLTKKKILPESSQCLLRGYSLVIRVLQLSCKSSLLAYIVEIKALNLYNKFQTSYLEDLENGSSYVLA